MALTGLTMAEYFHDVKNQDVLLFIDNIFRFTQAGSEVSTLLGRMPSAVGYQPNLLPTEMGLLQERITSTRGHSITSMQAIYVPADDYTDPAPQPPSRTWMRPPSSLVKSHRAVCTRQLTRCPPPPEFWTHSTSVRKNYDTAIRVKAILQENKELQDIIAILVWTRGAEDCRGSRTSYRAVPLPEHQHCKSSSPVSRVRPCR